MDPQKTEYTGFGLRFIAFAIDTVLISLCWVIFSFALMFTPISLFQTLLIYYPFLILVDAIYEISLTTMYGGTIGKLLMRVKVVSEDNKSIGLKESAIRYFMKYVSAVIVGIGFLMIFWEGKRQGLHDKTAHTLVVNNPESKISATVKKAVIILSIVALVGYVLYTVAVFFIGFTMGMELATIRIDRENPVQSVEASCGSKFWLMKDVCYNQLTSDLAKLNASVEERLSLCSKISDTSLKTDCTAEIAALAKDKKMCERLGTGYSFRLCEKQYYFADQLEKIIEANS